MTQIVYLTTGTCCDRDWTFFQIKSDKKKKGHFK